LFFILANALTSRQRDLHSGHGPLFISALALKVLHEHVTGRSRVHGLRPSAWRCCFHWPPLPAPNPALGNGLGPGAR
jgi:hypothetical protein